MSIIKLIIGLGNPGLQYANTRHNVGFMVIDSLVQKMTLGKPEHNQNYELWMHHSDADARVMLVKPQTFMNKSGEAVAELVRFFKIADDDILIIQDDVDLEFGTVRLRQGGGDGGHNGIASIHESLGHQDMRRIRVGIGRPPEGVPTDSYVLARFTPAEHDLWQKIVDQVGEIVLQLLNQKREFGDETIRIS